MSLKIIPLSDTFIVNHLTQVSPIIEDPLLEKKINALWKQKANNAGINLFNGKILCVKNFSEKSIDTFTSEYRYYLAQKMQPDLYQRLKIKTLSVNGLLRHKEFILFGLRSRNLINDPGKWELAPSGGLSTDFLQKNSTVNYLKQLSQEMKEELGIIEDSILNIYPTLLIEDDENHVIEICIDIELKDTNNLFQNSLEYEKIIFVKTSDVPSFCSKQTVLPVSLAFLKYRQFL